jgi:hypothetical protein
MTERSAGASAPIEDALDALAAGLPVRVARSRDGLLQEAHDGLVDAAEAYERQGFAPVEASRRAVADFGDPGQLSSAYAEEAIRQQARRTGTVLTAGYLLILSAWAVLGLLVPEEPEPGGRDWAASSFGGIGTLAAAVTAAVFVASRRRARDGGSGSLLAWVAGATGLACAVATFVASYLVHPWGAHRDGSLPRSSWTTPVEVLSAVVTCTILALSLRCLWSAWRLSSLGPRSSTPAWTRTTSLR